MSKETSKDNASKDSKKKFFHNIIDFVCDCGSHLHHEMASEFQPDTLCGCPVCNKYYMLTVEPIYRDDWTSEGWKTGNMIGFGTSYCEADENLVSALIKNASIIKSDFDIIQ